VRSTLIVMIGVRGTPAAAGTSVVRLRAENLDHRQDGSPWDVSNVPMIKPGPAPAGQTGWT
jgi:hypothetical protein